MSVPVASGLTYDDLWDFPQDDGLRRELIDGELYVSASPIRRHQRAVVRIAAALLAYTDEHGRYGAPATLDEDGVLTCRATPGLQLPVADVLHA